MPYSKSDTTIVWFTVIGLALLWVIVIPLLFTSKSNPFLGWNNLGGNIGAGPQPTSPSTGVSVN